MAGADRPDGSDADERRDGRQRRDEHGEDETEGREGRRKSGSTGGLRFRLPPIRLPEAVVPADLRISLPPPKYVHRGGLTVRSAVALALAFDLVDAGLALAGVGPVLDWTRVVAGLGLAAALTGVYGSLYAWEAVAVALGVEWASALPSVSLLLLVRGRDESTEE